MDRPDGRVICALLSASASASGAMLEPGACADELFVRADRAMYDARRAVRRAPVRAA